uniref:hypothetical protein n=1 Tax=Prevotella sp. TaxID=59823 RepID=UPI004025354D
MIGHYDEGMEVIRLLVVEEQSFLNKLPALRIAQHTTAISNLQPPLHYFFQTFFLCRQLSILCLAPS